MKIKKDDFIEIDYDLYANDKLVRTTSEAKAKESGLNAKEFGPATIIVGKEFILKALDEDIVKNADASKDTILNLSAEEAYGRRKKEMIKVIPKSSFDEHKTRPVVGMVYDFNGMYGTVKSVIGGRVMVDFNSPLAGKDIRLVYKVVKKIDDIKSKTDFVFKEILKIPEKMFEISIKEKDLTMKLPEELKPIIDMIKKTTLDYIPELKDYNIKTSALPKAEK